MENNTYLTPSLIKKGLSLYNIPTYTNGCQLRRVIVKGKIVNDYTNDTLPNVIMKLVLHGYTNSIKCVYN